jgi:hypothetical protein
LRRMQPLSRLRDRCRLEHRTEGLQSFWFTAVAP